MKILAIECSAVPASCAVIENGRIIASAFSDVKITHSQTLMPMAESVLASSELTLNDIDSFAVAVGPGSFTGIRIGIAAVKGMAAPLGKPVYAVSTLEGMAHMFTDTDCTLCCVMDARCNQVYNALFDIKGGVITRLTPDRALMCKELQKELLSDYNDRRILVTGDGADVFIGQLNYLKLEKAHSLRVRQNAIGIGLAAEAVLKHTAGICAEDIKPIYLRLPQAERELKTKTGER